MDVQPEDVDVRGDVVGGEGQLRGEVVDRAVVAARVDPEVVGHQALDAVGQLIAREHLTVVAEGVDVAVLVSDPAAVLRDVDPERGGARTEAPQHRCDRAGRRRRGGNLAPRHRTGGALPLDGRRIALADLLADLLGGRRLRLLPGGERRGLLLAARPDPAVAHRDEGAVHGHLVELVGPAALLGQFQIRRRGLGHGDPLPGRSQRPSPAAENRRVDH